MIWVGGAAALAAVLGVGLWLRGRYVVVTVRGSSMSPTFADGDRVLVRRRPGSACRPGDLTVFANPVRPDGAIADPRWLVKRVAAVAGDVVPEDVRAAVNDESVVPAGALVVRGDADRTQDSRHFGYVPTDSVLGTVVRRF